LNTINGRLYLRVRNLEKLAIFGRKIPEIREKRLKKILRGNTLHTGNIE